MAVKLSDLTTESSPASTDIIGIADPTTGIMRKITVQALKTYMDSLGGDVTAPTVTSATVSNGTPNQVTVVFSESVTVTTAGWSFRRNSANWAISSVSGSGNTWTFTMATSAVGGETLDRSYDAATGATVDGSANELASFTNSSVTNNVSGSDSDATAFITAVEAGGDPLSTTEENAITTLVLALKSASVWTKMYAIYPMVGGTASSCKWNLKNPLDTDAAHRIVWSGTPSVSATGVDFDGTDDYGDMKMNPVSEGWSLNNFSMGFYSRTNNSTGNQVVMGGFITSNEYAQLNLSAGVGLLNDVDDGTIDVTPANTQRLWVISRRGASDFEMYQDGASVGTGTYSNTGSFATITKLLLGARAQDNTNQDLYATHECAFAFVGQGLTDTEVANINTAVNTFQTTLSRNV